MKNKKKCTLSESNFKEDAHETRFGDRCWSNTKSTNIIFKPYGNYTKEEYLEVQNKLYELRKKYEDKLSRKLTYDIQKSPYELSEEMILVLTANIILDDLYPYIAFISSKETMLQTDVVKAIVETVKSTHYDEVYIEVVGKIWIGKNVDLCIKDLDYIHLVSIIRKVVNLKDINLSFAKNTVQKILVSMHYPAVIRGDFVALDKEIAAKGKGVDVFMKDFMYTVNNEYKKIKECFYGLTDEEKWKKIHLAYFAKIAHETLTGIVNYLLIEPRILYSLNPIETALYYTEYDNNATIEEAIASAVYIRPSLD